MEPKKASNYSHFLACGCSQSPCGRRSVLLSKALHQNKHEVEFKKAHTHTHMLVHTYLRLARMEVSWRSPGSNSWAPLRPSSSQPLRKTDRLSYRGRQEAAVSQSWQWWTGWLMRLIVILVCSYQSGDGGGQSVDLLDQAWFDCTQQPAWRRGGTEIYWVLEQCLSTRTSLLILHRQKTQSAERCHRLTRITGCRFPIRCGSPCLRSSSLSQPGDGWQEETDVREVDRQK